MNCCHLDFVWQHYILSSCIFCPSQILNSRKQHTRRHLAQVYFRSCLKYNSYALQLLLQMHFVCINVCGLSMFPYLVSISCLNSWWSMQTPLKLLIFHLFQGFRTLPFLLFDSGNEFTNHLYVIFPFFSELLFLLSVALLPISIYALFNIINFINKFSIEVGYISPTIASFLVQFKQQHSVNMLSTIALSEIFLFPILVMMIFLYVSIYSLHFPFLNIFTAVAVYLSHSSIIALYRCAIFLVGILIQGC